MLILLLVLFECVCVFIFMCFDCLSLTAGVFPRGLSCFICKVPTEVSASLCATVRTIPLGQVLLGKLGNWPSCTQWRPSGWHTAQSNISASVTRLGYGLEGPGLESPSGKNVFLFFQMSTPNLGPTQPTIQCVVVFFHGGKAPGDSS